MILRAGGSVNIAENQNNDFMLSGGLGFRFGNFLLDLTGAGAFNSEEFATSTTSRNSVPTRLSISVNLSWQSRPEGARRHTGVFDAVN